MLHPIKLQIRKKTLVPTKKQRRHQHRSDWIPVAYVEYEESRDVFKNVSPGTGLVQTDAQFAKLLKDEFGEGEYSIMAWKKGRKGFWPFLQVVISKRSFRRVESKVNKEYLEAREHSREHKKLSKEHEGANEREKESIESEMKYHEEMMSLNKEILKVDKKSRKGPYPYLKSTQPVYREHDFEEYRTVNKGDIVNYDKGMDSIW